MIRIKGQIWVETVIYILIGLALIGVILVVITPKINENRDRITVEQSISALNVFDEKINDVFYSAPGNVRIIDEFSLKKGDLFINADEDKIVIYLSGLSKPYSEPDVEIDLGRVTIISTEGQKTSTTNLTLDYSGLMNITFEGSDASKKFNAGSIPYKFSIKNVGEVNSSDLITLDIEEISRG